MSEHVPVEPNNGSPAKRTTYVMAASAFAIGAALAALWLTSRDDDAAASSPSPSATVASMDDMNAGAPE